MLGIILGCPDPKPPTWGGIPNRRELAHTSMVDFDGFPVGIYIYTSPMDGMGTTSTATATAAASTTNYCCYLEDHHI